MPCDPAGFGKKISIKICIYAVFGEGGKFPFLIKKTWIFPALVDKYSKNRVQMWKVCQKVCHSPVIDDNFHGRLVFLAPEI